MGQAKRRKVLGLMPEKTSKPMQRARIKRDNDLIGMDAFPMAMAVLLGMMSHRRRPLLLERIESRDYYHQEANEEEYQKPTKHVVIPDIEEVEEEE